MTSQRQDMIALLPLEIAKMKVTNGYTRNAGAVTFLNLSVSNITEIIPLTAPIDIEPGGDVTDDKTPESSLKVQWPVLIKTFIKVNTDISQSGLMINEAEEWLKNWEWFFYGSNKAITRDNIFNVRKVTGFHKVTIIARDPVFAKGNNKQVVAILIRFYFNQFKQY
jgi:hypothetical protein